MFCNLTLFLDIYQRQRYVGVNTIAGCQVEWSLTISLPPTLCWLSAVGEQISWSVGAVYVKNENHFVNLPGPLLPWQPTFLH